MASLIIKSDTRGAHGVGMGAEASGCRVAGVLISYPALTCDVLKDAKRPWDGLRPGSVALFGGRTIP